MLSSLQMDASSSYVYDEDFSNSAEDNMEGDTFEDNKCGICLDVVVDRGELNCCDDWFCFACIDNWATIINKCPLCRSDFQTITCVPVYDTIGSIQLGEYSDNRDEEWSIEGKNNTLTFPSYYIDEDAVRCLGGDGCKVHGGQITGEKDAALEMSIACDSCDIWYHAFCVGFDPQGEHEGSWFCPRCTVEEVSFQADPMQGSIKDNQRSYGTLPLGVTLSGKLSVSVADVGETAVVVSLVQQEHPLKSRENLVKESQITSTMKITEMPPDYLGIGRSVDLIHMPESYSSPQAEQEMNNHGPSKSSTSSEDLTSVPQTTSLSENQDPETCVDLHCEPRDPIEYEDGPSTVEDPSDPNEADSDCNLGMLPGSYVLEQKKCKIMHQDMPPSTGLQHDYESGSVKTTGVKNIRDAAEESHASVDAKNKRNEALKRKTRPEQNSDTLRHLDIVNLSNATGECVEHGEPPGAKRLKTDLPTEEVSDDIINLVKEADHKAFHVKATLSPKTTKKGENIQLRMKKILRRGLEDNETSALAQKIKEEVRDVLCNKTSERCYQDDVVDAKLLTAFRAATSGSHNEQEKRANISLAAAKKTMLQKGKVREHLTRKLYGTASGRRRRAWDRDWEIEFWKHRCVNGGKVETLQSVLNLLKGTPDSSAEMSRAEKTQEHDSNSLLSRLYLADASVFPRKDDIKPFSDLEEASVCKEGKMHFKNGSEPNIMVSLARTPKEEPLREINKMLQRKKGLTSSLPTDSSVTSQQRKEVLCTTDNLKDAKREWALSFLKRKVGETAREPVEKLEERSLFEKSFPLLAQLPGDMRPTLTPGRLDKIPISIRQGQLNRLIEHFLRKASLSEINRCADTELAVADALNVEKQIFERSKSKLVYTNLCSQAVSQHTIVSNKHSRTTETLPDNLSHGPAQTLEPSGEESALGEGTAKTEHVEQALREAGLLSDSPPNSPCRTTGDRDTIDLSIADASGKNALALDSHADLNIHGDFEDNLDGEHASPRTKDAFGSSKLLTQEIGSKVTFVLRTTGLPQESTSENLESGSKLSPTYEVLKERARTEPGKPANEADGMLKEEAKHETESSMPDKKHYDVKKINPGTVNEEVLISKDDIFYRHGEKAFADKITPKLTDEMQECTERLHHNEASQIAASENTTADASAGPLEGPDHNEALPLEESENTAVDAPAGSQLEGPHHDEALPMEESENAKADASDAPKIEHEIRSTENVSDCESTAKNGCAEVDHLPPDSGMEKNTTDSRSKHVRDKKSGTTTSISVQVEKYIKAHIKPLCFSGLITDSEYRWAVSKTLQKVISAHPDAKDATFLIKGGDKVKKVADAYVQMAKHKSKQDLSVHKE